MQFLFALPFRRCLRHPVCPDGDTRKALIRVQLSGGAMRATRCCRKTGQRLLDANPVPGNGQ